MKTFTTTTALLGLCTFVQAFYPYHFPTSNPSSAPSRIKHRAIITESSLISFPLHRVAVKRANTHPIVQADQPAGALSAGVSQDGLDYSYMIEIQFGPNKKVMHLLLDTAAINTWVMSSDCKSDSCATHNTYGTGDSSTLTFAGKSFSIAYGSGAVAGTVATDNVTVLGKTFPLNFGLASNVSNDFTSYSMDGIVGFGRIKQVANNPNGVAAPTLMDTLIAQGIIKNNLFGLRLSRAADGQKNGKIDFGEADTSAFTGNLNFITTTPNDRGFWEIPVDRLTYDGNDASIQTGVTAILDSGTSFMILPPVDAQAIHDLISGSAKDGDAFTVPCNSAKSLSMSFGGTAYNISPKDYVGEIVSGQTCSSNIVGRTTFGNTQWLIGDVFLKNVYSVYDADQSRVGLAPIAGNSDTASSPKSSSSGSHSPILPGTTMAVDGSKSSNASAVKTGLGNTLEMPGIRYIISTFCLFQLGLFLL